jgi:hypothetical protein
LFGPLNRKALNKSFTEKKKEYAKSDISQNKELAKLEKWSSTEINNRTSELFKLAKEIWKLPLSEKKDSKSPQT